jgi:hypothetical protein
LKAGSYIFILLELSLSGRRCPRLATTSALGLEQARQFFVSLPGFVHHLTLIFSVKKQEIEIFK